MPMTLVIPNMDIGMLLSFSPRQISVTVSGRILLLTIFTALRAPLIGIHTRNSTSNDINTDRAGTATKESRDNQSREIGRRRRRNEPDQKEDVGAEVAGHTTSILSQRHE